MLELLIFSKKVTKIVRPLLVSLILVAAAAYAVTTYTSEEIAEIIKWGSLGMSAILLVIGSIVASVTEDYRRYIKYPYRLILWSASLTLLGILLWQTDGVLILVNSVPYLVGAWIVLTLYHRQFKRLITSLVLKSELDDELDYIPHDIEKSAAMVASQMGNSIKEKYRSKIKTVALTPGRNGDTKLMDFPVGFVTNKKRPSVLFELIAALEME